MQTNAYWLNKINMPYPSDLSEMAKVSAALKKYGVSLFVHQGGYKYHWQSGSSSCLTRRPATSLWS